MIEGQPGGLLAHDHEAGVTQPGKEVSAHEKADVAGVQDAALVVVEQPQRRAPTRVPVAEVGTEAMSTPRGTRIVRISSSNRWLSSRR